MLNLNFSETEHATEIDFGLDIQLGNEFPSHIRIHERRGALKSAHSVPYVHFGSRILLPLLYFSQSQPEVLKMEERLLQLFSVSPHIAVHTICESSEAPSPKKKRKRARLKKKARA